MLKFNILLEHLPVLNVKEGIMLLHHNIRAELVRVIRLDHLVVMQRVVVEVVADILAEEEVVEDMHRNLAEVILPVAVVEEVADMLKRVLQLVVAIRAVEEEVVVDILEVEEAQLEQ